MKRKRRAPKGKATAPKHQPMINGDKYIKNKVLVFKLRKRLKKEIKHDQREIAQLHQLVKRARKWAA